MRYLFATSLAAILAASCFQCAALAADEWVIRVVTTSRVCHVQLKTAASLGADFKTGFKTRKDACQEAKNQYDKDLSNPAKCWTYGGGTVSACGADGITLAK
jgi:hypothetical protein